MPETAARPSTREQHYRLSVALLAIGCNTRTARLAELSRRAGFDVPAFAALDMPQAEALIIEIERDAAEPWP